MYSSPASLSSSDDFEIGSKQIALYKAAGKDFSGLQAELVKTAQKGDEDITKNHDQAMQQYVKEWDSLLTPIQSAWDSQLKKLLAGTETFGQAMKNIFSQVALDAIKKLESIAVEQAAIGVAKAAGGGPLSLLGSLTGGAGQASGSAALTTGALTLQTGSTSLLTAATTLQAAATSMAAGAAGSLAGPLDLLKFALPAFDVGSWSVPGDMVAQVHQNEMIIPNNGMADAVRGMLSGGGGGSNFSLNINGAVGTQQWLNQMAQQLSRTLQSYQARTPSTGW